MLKNIVKEFEESTLAEKITLGILAGLFAIVGFYVGYKNLSNGVEPLIVGLIVAVIFAIGGMAVTFLIDEALKKILNRKNTPSSVDEKEFATNSLNKTEIHDESKLFDDDENNEGIIKRHATDTKNVKEDASQTEPHGSTEVNLQESMEPNESAKDLSLVDFIKQHPDYSPRKMTREYINAGGKDSTDDILTLMSH